MRYYRTFASVRTGEPVLSTIHPAGSDLYNEAYERAQELVGADDDVDVGYDTAPPELRLAADQDTEDAIFEDMGA